MNLTATIERRLSEIVIRSDLTPKQTATLERIVEFCDPCHHETNGLSSWPVTIARAIRLADDFAGPLHGPSTDGGRGKGDHSDPTALVALRPGTMLDIDRRYNAALTALDRATALTWLLCTGNAPTARRKPAVAHLVHTATIVRDMTLTITYHDTARTGRRDSTSGACEACTRPVSGAVNDRLRAGYCHACYVAWCRAARPDRHGFARSRPDWRMTEPTKITATEAVA